MDKIRKNYYIKKDVVKEINDIAQDMGCSASYLVQMLMENHIREKIYNVPFFDNYGGTNDKN